MDTLLCTLTCVLTERMTLNQTSTEQPRRTQPREQTIESATNAVAGRCLATTDLVEIV